MIDAAVVDVSVAVKWWVREPDSEQAARLQSAKLYAPDLLSLEVASALWSCVARGILTAAATATALGQLDRAPITWTPDRSLATDALALAHELGHPVYDCTYVALAETLNVPLVTADRRLVAAFRRAGSRPANRILTLESLA